MGTLIKFLLGVLITIALLLGAAATYLLVVFDPNDYKSEIQSLIKTQAGVDVDIDGTLELSLFPRLSISANDVRLDSETGTLASVNEARFDAQLRPLLDGELSVDGVLLKGLKLNFDVNEGGESNWSFTTTDSAETETQSVRAEEVAGGAGLAALSVGRLAIEDGTVKYRNQQTQQDWELKSLNFEVSQVSLTNPFPTHLDTTLVDHSTRRTIPLAIDTKLTPKPDEQGATFDNLTLTLAGIPIQGELQLSTLDSNPVITTKLEAAKFSPAQLGDLLATPALADFDIPLGLALALQLDTGKDTLSLEQLELSTPSGKLRATLNATQISSDAMQATGEISTDTLNLRKLMAALDIPLDTADPKALEQLSLSTQISANNKSIELKPFSLKLDNTSLNGELRAIDFDNPSYYAKLTGDRINMDSYSAPATDKAGANQPATGDKESEPPPIAALALLNLDLSLAMDEITASGVTIKPMRLKTSSKDLLLNIQQLDGGAFNGTFQAKGQIDARSTTPKISFSKQLKNIDAGPALNQLADMDIVSGKLNVNIKGKGQGASQEAIINSLTGTADYRLEQGVLKEVSLERLVCEGIAKIRGLQLAEADQNPDSGQNLSESQQTQIKVFTGTMVFDQGIIKSEPLDVAISNMKAQGTGAISLKDQSFDYRIGATLLGSPEDKACSVNERYLNIAWPVRCKGNLEGDLKDACSVDQKAFERIIQKLIASEVKEKAQDAIDDKLRDKIGDDAADVLKELFNF